MPTHEPPNRAADDLMQRPDTSQPAMISRLQLDTALLAEQAFQAAVAASEPFRDGLLFDAIPNVKFYSRRGLIRAPGPLLAESTDGSAAQYGRRVRAQLDDSHFHLLVEHPLVAHYDLWRAIRAFVRRILSPIGCPILPIVCDLSIGCFTTTPRLQPPPASCFGVLVVLRGQLQAVLQKQRPESANRARQTEETSDSLSVVVVPEQALYVPRGYMCREAALGEVVALRLWFPSEDRSALDAVKPVIASLMRREMGDPFKMPYLPYPSKGGDRTDTCPAPMANAGEVLTQLAYSDELTRRLEIAWAKRASADGLEPVPGPRSAHSLRDDDLIRMNTQPSQVFENDRGALAVNGHAFSVTPHPVVLALLDDLRRGTPHSMKKVLTEYGDSVRPLLNKLYALRALDVVSE